MYSNLTKLICAGIECWVERCGWMSRATYKDDFGMQIKLHMISSHSGLLPADDVEDFPERGEWNDDDGADYDEN